MEMKMVMMIRGEEWMEGGRRTTLIYSKEAISRRTIVGGQTHHECDCAVKFLLLSTIARSGALLRGAAAARRQEARERQQRHCHNGGEM